MSLATFTFVHVVLSLAGIGTGFVVLYGMLAAKRVEVWTAIFLASTVLTSVTGFLFPFERFLPSHAVGILSLVALAAAIVARYPRQLVGAWRTRYVISSVIALYFNVFVLIAQLFLKVPLLKAMAPTQSEPAFVVSQSVALVLFIGFGIAALIRFRVEPGCISQDMRVSDINAFPTRQA